jgi:predicted transcriptional regulator
MLRGLWQLGPSTVREVTDWLAQKRPIGYTTTLKMLQIMLDKGLVERDEQSRSHVYRAAAPPEHTRQHMVEDLMDRAFGGSPSRLVLSALSAKPATPEELQEIRRLLDEMEGEP